MVPLVVLAVFVAFACAVMWRPASIIALAVCVYPFEQWAQAKSVFFQTHSATINYGMGALALLAVALVMLQGKNPLNPMTGAGWCMLALYVFSGISCLWAPERATSLFLFRYHLPYFVTFVGLVPLIVQDPRDVRYALKLTLFFGVVVMLLLFFGTRIHAWGRTIVVEEGMGVIDRVGQTKTRLGPLAVASMAGHIMMIGVLMNFVGVGRIWQFLRWFVVFVALALIIRSQSRGQLIGAVMATMALIPYSRGNKRFTGVVIALATIGLTVVALIVAFGSFGETGTRWTFQTMEKTFQSTRLQYSTQLLTYWFESGPLYWLFGIGSSASFDTRIIGVYCHIVMVEILAELGVFSLCVYLLFLAFVARDAIRLMKVSKTSVIERGVTAAVLAILFFEFILTFKEGSFLTHTFTFGWGLIVSRMAALKLMEEDREKRRTWQNWYARYWYSSLPAAAPQAVRPSY